MRTRIMGIKASLSTDKMKRIGFFIKRTIFIIVGISFLALFLYIFLNLFGIVGEPPRMSGWYIIPNVIGVLGIFLIGLMFLIAGTSKK